MTNKSDSIASIVSNISTTPHPFVYNLTNADAQSEARFAVFRDQQLAHYLARTPSAQHIIRLLTTDNGHIVNDHIALRTFSNGESYSGKAWIESLFLTSGYQKEDHIVIEGMHLDCHWYEPPSSTNWPKVFISEQDVTKLPAQTKRIALSAISAASSHPIATPASVSDMQLLSDWLLTSPFSISSSDYALLMDEAASTDTQHDAIQYTAWTLCNGFQWNHFTVLLNALGIDKLNALEDLNQYVMQHDFSLNQFSGTYIQGSSERFLKQSSTKADTVDVSFSDGVVQAVPGSFIEFIERFYYEDGEPMRGFVAGNARGIFTSTNNKKT